MNLEEFNKLDDEQKTALLTSYEKNEADLKEKEIEISSLKNENDTFKETITKQEDDLKKTKELNYTLARNMDTGKPKMSFEEALHGLVGRRNQNDN